MRRITTEPLTAEAFAPFGEVLESPASPGRAYIDKMLENRRGGAAPSRADQGVTYGANVWHHPSTVFDREARFAVFMWKDGTSADDEFVEVQPFELHLG